VKSEKLEVKNLVFNYGEKTILNDISFEVSNGDFIAVVGKSGAGKSTLLRCLNLLNKPKSGEIIISDENIVNFNRAKLKLLRRDIAFIFQDYNVLDKTYWNALDRNAVYLSGGRTFMLSLTANL